MPVKTTFKSLEEDYAESAQRYLESLPPEHFMEATPQAMQREITLESLAVLRKRRPEVQVFNELLVQYEVPDSAERGQVVPDNMVVIWHEKIHAKGSYDLPLQPTGPFWVLEYVSKNSRRKDYVDNKHKYEHELRIPYYLIFEPEKGILALYRHVEDQFVTVARNAAGRFPIRELEVEVAIQDDWVRFWHKGELLPLPAELVDSIDRLTSELATERARADKESRRAEAQSRRADEESRRADQEKQAREALEREVAELRAKQRDVQN